MEIIILNINVQQYDAIGNDIATQVQVLSPKYKCYVYAEKHTREGLPYLTKEEMEGKVADIDNLIIYHHSIYWEMGEEILKKVRGKIVFCYHNITPAYFFDGYSEVLAEDCRRGREQTDRYITMYPDAYWFAASKYNGMELIGVNEEKIAIRPPFHIIEEMEENSEDKYRIQDNKKKKSIKLLTVGRLVPNKKYDFLIEVVRCYCENFDENIKLIIVGKQSAALTIYQQQLKNRIHNYRLEKQIYFAGSVSKKELEQYYKTSDFYVCGSEHEGFCVPLLESQYMNLPVLSRDFGAIGDTMGKADLELSSVEDFAIAIHIIMQNPQLYRAICKAGKENYWTRFSAKKLRGDFIEKIDHIVKIDNHKI